LAQGLREKWLFWMEKLGLGLVEGGEARGWVRMEAAAGCWVVGMREEG